MTMSHQLLRKHPDPALSQWPGIPVTGRSSQGSSPGPPTRVTRCHAFLDSQSHRDLCLAYRRATVRVFFFCCLVFFVVWAFRMLFFCCLGGVFFFCFFCLGGGPGPAQTVKKNTPPPKQQKKARPRPFRACLFFAVWAGGCVCFFAVWAGGAFFVVWAGGWRFFAVWAGACSFFAVWAGGVFFLLFGPGAFFFAVWAGDGSSLTCPSAWLVFKRPNNKRDRTAKKKHGFPKSNLYLGLARHSSLPRRSEDTRCPQLT